MRRILLKLAILAFILFNSSCKSEQIGPQIDCTTSPIVISIDEQIEADCGVSNGSFTLSATGGIEPYSFKLASETNADGIFTAIAAGNYQVVVIDSVGCSEEVDVSIKNRNGVNIDQVITSESECGKNEGSLQIIASGGVEPYTYSLDDGAPQTSNKFTNLNSGNYNVSVADASGCETTKSAEVLSSISFENSIKQIIETNCAISGCHNGNVSPDLRSFSSIQSNAGRIRSETSSRSMPRGRSLSQTQIDMIACWVDAGAPNN